MFLNSKLTGVLLLLQIYNIVGYVNVSPQIINSFRFENSPTKTTFPEKGHGRYYNLPLFGTSLSSAIEKEAAASQSSGLDNFKVPKDYNPEVRPGRTKKTIETDKILCGLDILKWYEVDPTRQLAHVDLVVTTSWKDHRLNGITTMGYLHGNFNGKDYEWPVWVPDIYVVNSSEASGVPEAALWFRNGELMLSQRMTSKVTLSFDLWGYPFDRQIIQIKLGSLRYGPKSIDLLGYDVPTKFKPTKSSTWKLESWQVRDAKEPSLFSTENVERVIGAMLIKRISHSPYLIPLFATITFAMTSLFISHQKFFSAQLSTASVTYIGTLHHNSSISATSGVLWVHWYLLLCFVTSTIIVVAVTRFQWHAVLDEEEEVGDRDKERKFNFEKKDNETKRDANVALWVRRIRIIIPVFFYFSFSGLMLWNWVYNNKRDTILRAEIKGKLLAGLNEGTLGYVQSELQREIEEAN